MSHNLPCHYKCCRVSCDRCHDYCILKAQIESYGVDPSSPLPNEDDESNGVNVSEPSCPLNTEGFTAFKEMMTGVIGTDAWDISPYLHSLAVLRQLKEQFQ